MNTQHEEIKAGLDILFEPGQVFEVRALGKWTYAGFFNDTNIAAREIIRAEQMNKYAGIYVTINPVNPDLFYRCSNRMMDAGKTLQLTGNGDIILRKWLIIDIDPERISGISASDAEKALAFEMLPSVKGFLTSAGFPEPIIADSGNGAHLLYKLDDIPADSDLISKFLTGLAKRFDSIAPDAKCKIDTSVSNAARISKVYGTMSRKGDNSETRPHRRSKILCAPSCMDLVTEEHITEVLYLLYPRGETVKEEEVPVDYVKVSEYLDAWGITYSGVKRSGNENIYTLDDCPFSPDHSDGAYVCQNVITGAISAKCHHDRCGGGKVNHWKELRNRYDPSYDLSGVDSSGILNQGTRSPALPGLPTFEYNPELEEKKGKKASSSDTSLLSVPGVLQLAVNYYQSTALKPQPEFAVACALAIGATCLSRQWRSSQNNYTSLYFLLLGKSSTGKEHGKTVIETVLRASGEECLKLIGPPGYTSAGGIITTLKNKPRHICIQDEMGKQLQHAMASRNSQKDAAYTMIMEIFGRQAGFLAPDAYSNLSGKKRDDDHEQNTIERPAITIFGISTPSTLYKAINSDSISSGYLPRFIIIESEQERILSRWIDDIPEVPGRLIEWCKQCAIGTGESGNLSAYTNPPEPRTIPFHSACRVMLEDFESEIIKIQNGLDGFGISELWGRVKEIAQRISLIIAVSCESDTILPEHLDWAMRYVKKHFEKTTSQVQMVLSNSDYEAVCKEVLTIIKKAGLRGATESEIHKRSSLIRALDPKMVAGVYTTLSLNSGVVLANVVHSGGGRPRVAWVYSEDAE